MCVTKAAERQHQSDDYNYQEWYRFVVWEDDKNTRFSLQHYEVLVSKSFLQENSSQKIITKRGGNKVVKYRHHQSKKYKRQTCRISSRKRQE